MIVAISVFTESKDKWLKEDLPLHIELYEVKSCSEMKIFLKRLVWVDLLHD
jgi:hypothetical protein